jgi:tetratricopeptide (TPR) repeat protein
MRHLMCSALVLAVASTAVCSAALAQASQSENGLPMGPDTPVRGVVPGVGPTPGLVLLADNPAIKCSRDAIRAADGLMAPQDAIGACNDAIVSGVIAQPELAGTLVNRGVLLMTMLQPQDAKADFNRALQIEPSQAEALVNRGSILLGEGKPQEALADLNLGIALGPAWPERAYYTRGLVREDLKDIRGAYADYKMAQALKPGWQPVISELSRFRVVTR